METKKIETFTPFKTANILKQQVRTELWKVPCLFQSEQ